MNPVPLSELISKTNNLLEQIKQHPQYKLLDFHGDVTAVDAQQFLTELGWELQGHNNVDIQRFEGYLQ